MSCKINWCRWGSGGQFDRTIINIKDSTSVKIVLSSVNDNIIKHALLQKRQQF